MKNMIRQFLPANTLVSKEKIFFGITVVPYTFPVPLLVKHNKNLKCEITEHWFVFVYSKCDFWTFHAKKNLPVPNFSLIGPLDQTLLKKM